jgi:hypothetical protein
VEYEDRRDADDAYHDMHNKRIGRDDILKIEVSLWLRSRSLLSPRKTDTVLVGSHPAVCFLAVRPQRPGPWAAPFVSPPPVAEPAAPRVLASQG